MSNENNNTSKRVHRVQQTRPIIFSAARSRVNERVMMSASTSRDLKRYVRWASQLEQLDPEETQVMFLDMAIGEILKRDLVWQKASQTEQQSGQDAENTAEEIRTPVPAPKSPPSRLSPPPSAPASASTPSAGPTATGASNGAGRAQ